MTAVDEDGYNLCDHDTSQSERDAVNADNAEVLDATWYRIQTAKGEAMVIEFRVDHNGYYGGWAQLCGWPKDVQFRCIAPAERVLQ